MAQLLEASSASLGLGLCQVGWLDFDQVRPLFALDHRHEFLHAVLGGGREEREFDAPATDNELERLRRQVAVLAPAEVDAMLAALSAGDDSPAGE
jgi:hypothetical protein